MPTNVKGYSTACIYLKEETLAELELLKEAGIIVTISQWFRDKVHEEFEQLYNK